MATSKGAEKDAGQTQATGNIISAIAQDADKDIGLTAISNYFNNKNAKRTAQENIDTVNAQNAAVSSAIKDYYTNNATSQNTSSADVDSYYNAIRNYNPNDYVYDFDEFDYDKTVDDFYNPNKDKIIDATAKTTQQTASGAGIGRGTGAATKIATDVADKNEALYNDALTQYNTDKASEYNEWSDYINKNQNKLNSLSQATNTQITNLGTVANAVNQNEQNEFEDTLGAQINANTAYNTAKAAKDNSGTADSGVFGIVSNLF
jgi:hypothetical protein